MPVNMNFPTTQEINHIVRNTIVNTGNFRGNEFAPVVGAYAAEIMVDVIDATYGITPPKALNANPKVASLSGQSVRRYATGYWAETYRVNEEELLYARQEGTFNERAGRLRVVRRSNELNVRLDTRIEKLRWDAIVNGKIEVDDNGVKYIVDMKMPTANKNKTYKLSDATDDPLKMIAELQEMYFGTGAKLDTIYMPHQVAKIMAANPNVRDLLKQSVYAVNLSASNIDKAMVILFPEVKFVVYTEVYSVNGKDMVQFIPANKIVCVGKGAEPAMDFCTTLALQNGGMESPQPGKYGVIEDKSSNDKNPHVDITVGMNGLPRMHHANWFNSVTIT